jgi:penicillin-binding protein 2
MDLKISKQLNSTVKRNVSNGGKGFDVGYMTKNIKRSLLQPSQSNSDLRWNYLLIFFIFILFFAVLILELSSLQVAHGEEMLIKSENNQIKIRKIPAYRGVIFDRNGKKLVVNESSMNVYLALEHYLDEDGYIDTQLVEESSDTLAGILGDNWSNTVADDEEIPPYTSISEKIYSLHKESPYFTEILIATDIDNDTAIKIKARAESLPGVYIDSGNKRMYPEREILSHILGYTGTVSAEDLDELEYIQPTDVIGRTGLERKYDKELLGEYGEIAWEVDAMGRTISKEGYIVKEPVSGKNLYLSLDLEMQRKLYEILQNGVSEYGAVGGAGILQDPNTGEILALVSFPSYDNNLFVGGISVAGYGELINDTRNPLMNRAIAAQMPPGSTFKTIVAVGGLEGKAITKNTIYVSRRGYTFSSGAPFQDYRNIAYGSLNLIDAIAVSSNIYFCELIRNWDMNKLVPYLEKFGIGRYTGIDIPGEAPGRMPSPANKIALANTISPWLDPVWYPEGDSCNSVIGQGIALVTPLQMVNWVSAIANDGTLYTPHVGGYFLDEEKERTTLEYEPIYTEVASKESLKTVREGMWAAVNGPRATIRTLSGMKVAVAAKTGTAEFGAINKDGQYENTHAWATGFFPYENPKYSFTIFLEDGGESINAVRLARQMIEWMIENELI